MTFADMLPKHSDLYAARDSFVFHLSWTLRSRLSPRGEAEEEIPRDDPVQRSLARQRVMLSRRVIAYYVSASVRNGTSLSGQRVPVGRLRCGSIADRSEWRRVE